MQKKNIFFDLDGTIVNSQKGIFNSVEYSIEKMNFPKLDKDTLRKFIGPPLHYSYKKYFDIDDETTDESVKKYREYYKAKGIFECELYPGMIKMLEILSKEYDLYVTTSKPLPLATKVLQKLNADIYFKEISGPPFDGLTVTKAHVVTGVIKKYNLKKEECVLIGDTRFDGEGAFLSGIDFIGVSYGFGTLEELNEFPSVKVLNSTDEITDYFKKAERN